MKKSLIAAAALTAFAGAAAAQSSVSISGVIDAGYGSFDAKAGTAAKVTQKGISFNNFDSSRLNISATEDIGGGLKAGAVIETWLSDLPRYNYSYNSYGAVSGATTTTAGAADTVGYAPKATTLGNRLFYVNLKSGAHELRAGQQSGFVRDVSVGFQADGANLVGNVIANDGLLAGRSAQVAYIYDNAGLTLGAAFTETTNEKDAAADIKTKNGYSLMAGYAAGPFAAKAAYQEFKTDTAAVTGVAGILNDGSNTVVAAGAPVAGTSYVIAPVAAAAAKETKSKITSVGASYDLTVAKLYAQYGKVTVDNTTSAAAASGDSDRHFYSFGARVPLMAKTTLQAQYSTGKASSGTTRDSFKGDVTGYTVAVKYDLSKRTYGYVGVGSTKQETAANTETKANQAAVGMVHAF